MPAFDRFDICCAYSALEYDWNAGGWLRERPSNQRRRESIEVQLHRMGFKPSGDEAAGFAELLKGRQVNRLDIYVEAVVKFGLAPLVDPKDDLGQYISATYAKDWIAERFPSLSSTKGLRP